MSENCILTKKEGSLYILTLNRPSRKNALNREILTSFGHYVNEAASDSTVKFLVITGSGDYFCSGNDLSNFGPSPSNLTSDDGDMQASLQYAKNVLSGFIKPLIDFPKPIIGVINGPAIGLAVTTLALYDLVYASDRATFSTPFTTLGQTPEGCSSHLFPLLMGHSKAAEVLLFGKKLSAQEAYERNLVTHVFQHNEMRKIWKEIKYMSETLPTQTLINGKAMLRKQNKHNLHQVCDQEVDQLIEQWQSEEFVEAIMNFMSRKSKL